MRNKKTERDREQAGKLFRDAYNLKCRVLSRGEINFFFSRYHRLARFNGQNLTHCIFYKKKSKIQQPIVNIKSYNKLNAFFDWISSLHKYDDIYVFANSNANDVKNIYVKNNDLIICFNRYPIGLIENNTCDSVIVNRQINDTERSHTEYCNYDNKSHDIKVVIIMNDSNELNSHNDFFSEYSYVVYTDLIPYSLHPCKVPSSGYVILFLLNYIYENTDMMKRIHPVGFQFSESGWQGHDWALERSLKKSMKFDWR